MKSKGLHANNKFAAGYNFEQLIEYYPDLGSFCIRNPSGSTTIDYSNSEAVKALNTALLFSYQKLRYWDFPETNLCPPIPGRLDYILHLADLIGTQADKTLLDIGTGATCIYPLLGVLEFNWSFVGTDIDTKSLKNAQHILDQNQLNHSVRLRRQHNKAHVLKGIVGKEDHFDAVLCNPPFYKSLDEAHQMNQKKSKNLGISANRNFSGSDHELWYPGGEKAFLHTYLYESSLYPNASTWYTSLVSQKENVKPLEASAKKLGARMFKVILMRQGHKQTRIVAWNF